MKYENVYWNPEESSLSVFLEKLDYSGINPIIHTIFPEKDGVHLIIIEI